MNLVMTSSPLAVVGCGFDKGDAADVVTAHVLAMYVKPASRGTGAGRALLDALIALASQRPGVQVLNLTVTEGNDAAVNLYRSAGFEPFGTEPMAILTPSGFKRKVHMWRQLPATP